MNVAECILGHWVTAAFRRRRSESLPLVPFPLRYRYLSRLGEGAQGVVHLCDDLLTPGKYVAIKTARPDAEAQGSLQREADALWTLRGSPSVPELRALLYKNGTLSGFVTRYFGGETLDDVIDRSYLTRKETLTLTISTVDSVLDLLRRGYLHRDIKPENLLWARKGTVQILDYGLACPIEKAPDGGELSGTLGYSSPEQLEARSLTKRSDLFSLGVVLYEIARGKPLFSCGTKNFRAFMNYRSKRLRETLDLRGVETGTAGLIQRLIVADPVLRADISEVEARLARLRSTLTGYAA